MYYQKSESIETWYLCLNFLSENDLFSHQVFQLLVLLACSLGTEKLTIYRQFRSLRIIKTPTEWQ